MTAIRGYPTQQKLERLTVQFATVEPVRKEQNAVSVLAHQYVYAVGTDAVEADSTTSAIVATAHAAKEGDVILFTSGALSGIEVKVYSTSTNLITLAENLSTAPTAGDAFTIQRHKYPLVEADGSPKVTVISNALPTGAATEATLSSLNGKVTACDTGAVTVASSALPTGAATESTLSTLSGKITACNTGAVTISSSALPTGAATESTLSTLNGKVTACDTGAVVIASSAAIPATQSGSWTVAATQSGTWSLSSTAAGKTAVTLARIDYSSTSVTTSAYTELVASLGSAITEVEIFDSSGQTLALATGGAGSESNKVYIFPGGNGRIPLSIAASARVSVKAVSATANAGELLVNFYG